jgi:signal transduction histidine kinase
VVRFVSGFVAVRRVARHACAVLGVALCAGAAVAAPAPLFEADFVLSESAVPPGDEAAWSKQPLPDEWRINRPRTSGTAWYRFSVALPAAPQEVHALYVPRGGDRLAVFLNGNLIGSTAEQNGEFMNTWKRPLLFSVPPQALRAGENRIHIQLQGWAEHQSGLSPVVFGPEGALRDAYRKRFTLQTVGPVGLAAALGLLGIFFLILWARRRDDSTYVLFGAASLVWAARNVLDGLFHLSIPQPHWGILMAALYFAFVGLLCIFSLRFLGLALPRYERLLRGSMLAAPLVLYGSLPWVSVLDSTRVLLLYMLSLVLPPLLAVTRSAIVQRNLGAILITLAGAVAFIFGAYDWFAASRQGMYDSVRLVPYAALFFTTAIGWLLVHRFMSAYAELERMNAELDLRVAAKSAELLNNMAQLELAKAGAEEANRAKSRFLAAASHDLRQPLQSLGLFVTTLGMKTSSPQTQDIVVKINQSVEALERMFTDLLDISRLDAGSIALERRRFPVQQVFDRLAVGFLPLAQQKGLRLVIRATPEWTESDPIMFERILRNLVSNAIRYTERGGVLVACRRRGRRLWIQVWDTGIGIPESEHEKIFEEFYQLGNPERDRRKGSGLGLGIVRRLAALLGERLTLRSVVGRGTVFALRTGRVPPDAHAPAVPRQKEFAGGERQVVLLEDDWLVREAMEGLLARRGFAVAAGAVHEEARQALLDCGRSPELIIADYRLQGGENGLTAALKLREEFSAAIPVLLLTGEPSREELAEAIAHGIPVLRKPVTGIRLFAQIEALLGRIEAEAE